MKKTLYSVFALALAVILTMGATAASFVPSVAAKPAPQIAPQPGGYVAEITKNGSHEEYLEEISLIVTPYNEKGQNNPKLSPELNARIEDNLEKAKDEVLKTSSLSELNPELDNIAKKVDPSYDGRVYVATNLFDITISDISSPVGYQDFLDDSTLALKITFSKVLSPDEPTPPILYRDIVTGKWEVIKPENIVREADGTITAFFPRLGAVLFSRLVASNMAPQTGDSTKNLYIGLAVMSGTLLVGAGVACVIVKSKKKSR